jgi:predicted helicase
MFESNAYMKDWRDLMLPENSERVKQQKQQPIQVIIGNPPYSAGQRSENDNNKNLKYKELDSRIRETYAEHSTATLKNSLYDSYIVKADLTRNKPGTFEKTHLVRSMYRPFCKQWLYFDRQFNERVLQMPKIFPNENLANVVICISAPGGTKESSALIINAIPDLHLTDTSQCFPLYTYEKTEQTDGLFATPANNYIKRDNIPNAILADFRKTYGDKLTKEDIFYYVYGILHSPDYKQRFAADLKKMLPRIPLVQDFSAFSHAGRQLAQWHLNYETIEPYPLQEITQGLPLDPKAFYRVQEMKFAKKDKTTLIYNANVTLTGIPLETYDYIVNGKPALEWIIERYQITTHKDSGIRNDPNDWSDNPRYIIDLVKRIVQVSLETVKIVKTLPKIGE